MVERVKRSYDNSRRQAQMGATRAEVVAAARALFVDNGYARTTIEAIGDAAGVPVATIYRLFGTKLGILSAVLDVAFVGDDRPTAFGDRPEVRAALDEPDPRRLLRRFAQLCRELLGRSAPVQAVLRTAAVVDEEAKALLVEINRQRLMGQSRIARALGARGALADGLNERAAADVIYALMSPELYEILTSERGWRPERYERWLADALAAQLLGR
jgi:AcrR family transcriptional regulator